MAKGTITAEAKEKLLKRLCNIRGAMQRQRDGLRELHDEIEDLEFHADDALASLDEAVTRLSEVL